jgi:hypothetical protein
MFRTRRSTLLLAAAITLVVTVALPTMAAAQVNMTVDFDLDKWWDVEKTSGSVTVHRIRVKDQKSNIKSKLFRPGNSEYLKTIVIEMEFSNDATRDIEADVNIEWKDSSGKTIDGYHDDEDFDEGERHEIQTITLSTLQYGLEVAKKLHIKIDW